VAAADLPARIRCAMEVAAGERGECKSDE